jgi:hypothetical protein
LVRRAHQWPGVTAQPEQLGRASWTARRPDFYFEQDPQWPECATLRLSMPDLRMDHALTRDEVARELTRLETKRSSGNAGQRLALSRTREDCVALTV